MFQTWWDVVKHDEMGWDGESNFWGRASGRPTNHTSLLSSYLVRVVAGYLCPLSRINTSRNCDAMIAGQTSVWEDDLNLDSPLWSTNILCININCIHCVRCAPQRHRQCHFNEKKLNVIKIRVYVKIVYLVCLIGREEVLYNVFLRVTWSWRLYRHDIDRHDKKKYGHFSGNALCTKRGYHKFQIWCPQQC